MPTDRLNGMLHSTNTGGVWMVPLSARRLQFSFAVRLDTRL